jgi:hypothetical protein
MHAPNGTACICCSNSSFIDVTSSCVSGFLRPLVARTVMAFTQIRVYVCSESARSGLHAEKE